MAKKINLNKILVITLPIVFGFLAGISGYALSASGGVLFPFFGRVNVSGLDLDRSIVIDQPRNVVIEQDLQVKQIENDLLPTLVNVYQAKKGTNSLSQAFLNSEILGGGFVLTSDGWIVVGADTISNLKVIYTAVGYQSQEHQLGGFIKDQATGLIFGKMPAQNLTVAKIGKSKDLTSGQTLVVVFSRNNLIMGNIKKIGYEFTVVASLAQSSDRPAKEIFLDVDLKNIPDGAVVANLKGEVVGLLSGGRVIPADYFKNIVSQVLTSQKIVRPILDVDYIDLAQTEGLADKGDKGALVYGAPAKTSPAFGKLKDGDIIKKIDDVEINVYQGLSELLLNYKPGDKIDLLISRNGKDETIEITLK